MRTPLWRIFSCTIKVLAVTLLSLSFSPPAESATFTVINTNRNGAGSLEQALIDANASAGPDFIHFNITSGTTIAPTNALPAIIDPVTIDGTTQTNYAGLPIIELNGIGAGTGTDGFKILTTNCTIRALVINRFTGDGIEIATNSGNNIIEGCYIGLNVAGTLDTGNTLNGILITNSANNIIGGLNSSNRNYISGNNANGILIGGVNATNNQVVGNVIGLGVNDSDQGNTQDGVRINGANNIIGDASSGGRNVISGNNQEGVEVNGTFASGNRILGNYIGPDSTGVLDRGNTSDGVLVVSVTGTLVGSAVPGAGNLISGNNGDGVELNGINAVSNLVANNLIGTDAAGAAALGNSQNGVLLTGGARSNIVGGISANEPNTIGFNAADGIAVAAAVSNTNNTFRGNSIFSNGDLGIDLGTTGITANDNGDPDTGANQLQNFPILSAATNLTTEIIIRGTFNSRTGLVYQLDFYASALPDGSTNGEGQGEKCDC